MTELVSDGLYSQGQRGYDKYGSYSLLSRRFFLISLEKDIKKLLIVFLVVERTDKGRYIAENNI